LWFGDTESLQDFRSWMLSMSTEFDGRPATELMTRIIEHDLKIGRITQREERLLKKVQEFVEKETLPLEKKRLVVQAFQQRLIVPKRNYWTLRGNWMILRDKLKGSTRRGFIECRSNPRWYLSDTLRRYCAELGGCYGRECQCCANRSAHLNSQRKLGFGHCTLECGCCSESRGFDFTSEEKKRRRAGHLRPGRCLDCPLCIRMVSASFWGLEHEELCLVRKWKWWLSTRIAFMGFTMMLLYYIS
jgi:hypothetical protein